MASRTTSTRPTTTTLPKGRKSTQRERILAGVVAVANRDGYAGVNVSGVIEQAGVSRPTFYDYFADKDEGYLAAVTDVQEQLTEQVRDAITQQEPQDALRAAVTALAEFAGAEPAKARFLMAETMAAGKQALDARDHGIDQIEKIIEKAHRKVPPTTTIPDISPHIVIGGVYRLLAARLRRGEPGVSSVQQDLVDWVARYEAPAGQQRWRSLKASVSPPLSPYVPDIVRNPPPHLGPGRQRLTPEEVAANHRQRILYAAADHAKSKGYTATTIADITTAAGIDGRAFYAAFTDKQEAFMAVHELGYQEVMAVTAGAFFAGTTWPERSWEAGRAFTQFLERHPTIAHVGFVEAYAVGPAAAQRVEDSHTAFTMFLQEGYGYAASPQPPTRVALEAIITSVFEVVYREVRAGREARLSRLLGHIVMIWLAPFLGMEAAEAFVDGKAEAG